MEVCIYSYSSYSSRTNINVEDKYIRNSSGTSGGAIFWTGSNGFTAANIYSIKNNTIVDCEAQNGGVIYASISSSSSNINDKLNIVDNTFINNTASNRGGVIYSTSGLNTNVDNNEFINSTAKNQGSAIYITQDDNKKVQ